MQKFKLDLANLGSIKFLLIVLIVCVHASPNVGVELTHNSAFQIYCSQILSRVAVPLYFFVSGYLMEMGLKNYMKWRQKINRRIRTIFIPYVLWNGIYGLFLLILSGIYNYNTSISSEDSFVQTLKHIFIDPAISPLWFLRDLFVFQLVSLVLIVLSYRFKIVLVALLFILWFYNFHIPYTIISSEGALFFTLGFFNWLPVFYVFKKYFRWICIAVCILSVIDTKIRYTDFWWSLGFHRITVLMLCYSFMVITTNSKYLKPTIQKVSKISGYSFYIFVLHFPILYALNHVLNSNNIAEYFVKIILAIVASIGIGYIINLFPKISEILTGNRT